MLKNNNEQCIELDGGNEDTTTNNFKNNQGNISVTTAITTVHTKISPSIHLAPLSTLISTPSESFSPPVLLVVDDNEPSELEMESLETLSSESRINSASDADIVSGASTCTAKALEDQTSTTITQQQQQKQLMKVAGPQQQQQRQLSLQEKKRLRQQNPVEKMFPHIAITHKKLRILHARPIGSTLQQELIKVINAYIAGCRNEYEENTSSPYKCRRLAHSMTRTMDLMQQICAPFEYTPEYIHRMIELVAIYLSCELRYAKEFKEHKPLIANRILYNIYKYLKGSNKDEIMTYILRMFAHMPRMYREREVMTKIFQTLIPQERVIIQRELPDSLYIQYIIVFYHWKQLELNHEEQMHVIEFANKLMRPAKTLCTNSTYAYHLPNYTCLQTATKFILQDLKFFHDLRNASIYDHRLQLDHEVIDISDEEHPKLSKTSVNIDFAELVQNAEIQPTVRPMVKLENQVVIATIDLTLHDKTEDDLEWLQELQRNAKKLEPTLNALSLLNVFVRNSNFPNGNSAATSEVIEIDSDTEGEEDYNELEQEQPVNLLVTESEQLSDHFQEFEEPDQANNLSDDNILKEKNAITVNSNKNTDHIKLIAEEKSNDASSMVHFSQQSTQVFPTEFNIISVCSIGATQTENNYNDCSVPLKSKVMPELLQLKPKINDMRSIAATQTEDSYIESAIEKSTDTAAQALPSKPTIIEILSIAKTKSSNNNCTPLATSTELELTQINPQISKALNADLITESNKQSVSSEGNETNVSCIDDILCRRNSLHLLSSPIRSSGLCYENNDTNVPSDINVNDADVGDDDETDICFFGSTSNARMGTKTSIDTNGFNNNKVIYSVAASTCPPLQKENTGFMHDDESPNIKQQSVQRNNVSQKTVQFSNKPLQRTGGTPITHPIKPAIKNSNTTYNNQSTPINSAVLRLCSASPASSTSSLSRTFQKDHCNAVQSVFREHYTDAEKRQVLHRQFLPSHLQRTIKKCRTTPTIGATRCYSSSSSSTDGPPHVATKMTCKEMLLAADSPNNSRSMHNYCSNYYHQTLDQNLKKTCRVDIERNYELDYKCVKKLNKLLQMQRERRQQALEKRQEAERQRVLKMKMLEEQNLKEQITEIKRQQEEKKAKRRRNENSKRKENKLDMRLKKRNEQPTTKMRQRTFSIDNRSLMEDTIQRSRLECGIEYFSDSAASVKSRKQLPISSVNNQPKNVPQEKGKKKEEEKNENEEELQRNLLRTPSPSPERILNASVTPKSATKPVKVRIKRIWQQNRIANELRVLAKEQAQELEEIESANLLAETNLEMQRKRKLVLAAKDKIRAELLEKDVLSMYDDRDGEEHGENDIIDMDKSINEPMTKLESEATPTAEKHSNKQALERTEFKELETPRFVETAAAASGLAMLANTAATAAIAVTRKPLIADIRPSTSAAAATGKEVSKSQQKHEDNDESVPPSQKLPNCCRISELAAAAGAAINHALANKSNITLINFEATPTVPAYLFNGESRDVPTPTPLLALPTAYAAAPSQELSIAETAPASAAVDSTLNSAERATRSTAASANAAATATVNTTLSTSDHEVSSTQETLCEALQLRCTNPSNALMFQTSSPNGNLSARRLSLSTDAKTLQSAALVGAAVQNNQVDTTHHLPESTTTTSNSSRSMRRRMHKLSTYDEISTAAGKEHNKQRHQPVHKRRKTICADDSFLVQPLAEPLANATEGHASSPSTTTVAVEKPTTRKRGRLATATTTSPKRKDVAKRSGANNTLSPLLKLVDDNTNAVAKKCSSPGVSSKLIEKHIKHTYSLNNIVKNVFVPPEIEEYLENENDAKSASTLPPTAAKKARDNTSTSFTAATSSSKAGTSSSSTKPNTTSIITKEKEPLIKTVRGAKMKMLQKKQQQQNVMKAGDSLAEEQQQQQQKKLKTIKDASSGRSRR